MRRTYFLWYYCYSTVSSCKIWQELELEPGLEPKINNFCSATATLLSNMTLLGMYYRTLSNMTLLGMVQNPIKYDSIWNGTYRTLSNDSTWNCTSTGPCIYELWLRLERCRRLHLRLSLEQYRILHLGLLWTVKDPLKSGSAWKWYRTPTPPEKASTGSTRLGRIVLLFCLKESMHTVQYRYRYLTKLISTLPR